MSHQHRIQGLFLGIALSCITPALAGDLIPPVGPVLPTMKPLSDVEPRAAISATNTPGDGDSIFRITQPGSYYLTGNITGVAGKSALKVSYADHVTIDLAGFVINGGAAGI